MPYAKRKTRFNGNLQTPQVPSGRGSPVSFTGNSVVIGPADCRITLSTSRRVTVDTSRVPVLALSWADAFNVAHRVYMTEWGAITEGATGTQIELVFPAGYLGGAFQLYWPRSSRIWSGLFGEPVGSVIVADWNGTLEPEICESYSAPNLPLEHPQVLSLGFGGSGSTSVDLFWSMLMNTSGSLDYSSFAVWGPDGTGVLGNYQPDGAVWADPQTLTLQYSAPLPLAAAEFVTFGGIITELIATNGAAVIRTLRSTIY